jgi:hypothetical protein
VLGTMIGLGKLVSSLWFGWLSQTRGSEFAVTTMGIGLVCALVLSAYLLRKSRYERLPT